MAKRRAGRQLPGRDQIDIMLEEYRALYGLLSYRFGAFERRVPLHGTVLTAFLGAIGLLTPSLQILLFIALPIALLWFVSTTLNHARSLEDLLRRIEEIERSINARTGLKLLTFQSSHPSRGSAIGGRTGRGGVLSVVIMSLILLAACIYQCWLIRHSIGLPITPYAAYVTTASMLILAQTVRLGHYRYRP